MENNADEVVEFSNDDDDAGVIINSSRKSVAAIFHISIASVKNGVE